MTFTVVSALTAFLALTREFTALFSFVMIFASATQDHYFKKKRMALRGARFFSLGAILLLGTASFSGSVSAGSALSVDERKELAREFVSRMKQGFERAESVISNKFPGRVSATPGEADRVLAEGELLLLEIRLPRGLVLDNIITGKIYRQRPVLSLRDFSRTLDFPIEVDGEAGIAQGWYIRERKIFSLNFADGTVTTDHGTFRLSETAHLEDGDIWVTPEEVAQWLNFDIAVNIGRMYMTLTPDVPLPLQERLERRSRQFADGRDNVPRLPLQEMEPKFIDVPIVDVATTSTYTKDRDTGLSDLKHRASVATSSEFAGGTLETFSRIDDKDGLASLRATYLQESLEPDLLGPLKARRYEVGDVSPVFLPLVESTAQGLGARVTNISPLNTYLRPLTELVGNALPGWDVELYRGRQLLGFQVVGEDGRYRFEDVQLFKGDNEFRLVMYGPQGEVQEENVYIPVDPGRLGKQGGVYDVSLTFENTQTYRSQEFEGEDDNAPNLVAFYEQPFGDDSAFSAGLQSKQVDGDRQTFLYGGLSQTLNTTLLNADIAVEDDLDTAVDFNVRRNFGLHRFRNRLNLTSEGFGVADDVDDSNAIVFRENFSVEGPLAILPGDRPRYNLALGYALDAQDRDSFSATAGFDNHWNRWIYGQKLTYSTSERDDAGDSNDIISGQTNVNGRFGRNNLRMTADYDIDPGFELNRFNAVFSRQLSNTLNTDIGVDRMGQPGVTEGYANLNWRTPYAYITPRVSYNSLGEFEMMLRTRFGLTLDPQSQEVKVVNSLSANNGALSAFVWVDENGDGAFNEGEMPVEKAEIMALQNGGRAKTDKEGYAFIPRLRSLKPTDVFLVPDSLEDPFWIPAFTGVSIIPQQGYVAELQFPVFIAGEIDGTVFARSDGGATMPLSGVRLTLYDMDGEAAYSTSTGADGFYLFQLVAPGEYYLIADPRDLKRLNVSQREPEPVVIGYDGTIIYGKNLYLDSDVTVPFTFPEDFADFVSANPQADFSGVGPRELVYNLGEYNSRLLMAVVWYRLKSRYEAILQGATPLVSPLDSKPFSSERTHSLRLNANTSDFGEASQKCRALTARGFPCEVEIITEKLLQRASYP